MVNEIFSIVLDKENPLPVYQQIGDALYRFIEEGILPPKTKLPPIRRMAEALKVNNVTIVNAYRYLENKKVVYSQVGSGTFVSELAVEQPAPLMKNEYSTSAEEPVVIDNAVNFATGSISMDFFPVQEFKIFFNEVLDRDGGNAFGYQESQGYAPLRETLCRYLETFQIKTTAEKIQVISGGQQGIDIISKAMLGMGDYAFVEKPTYFGAVGAFASRGAQVVEVPLLSDGLDMDKLESLIKLYRPKLIYIMPYFQTPTCYSYSLEKKKELLRLSAKYDFYIIEEDNQSEYHYGNISIMPLKALDYKNRVVYIKSFSKIIMPGLRLGFMVLPSKILHKVRSAKYSTDIATSGFIQRAFDLYLQSPYWTDYRKKVTGVMKKRYEIAVQAIEKYLNGFVTYEDPKGGLNFWLCLNEGSGEKFCRQLVERKIIVTPGEVYSIKENAKGYFRMGIGGVENHKIDFAVHEMAGVLINKA